MTANQRHALFIFPRDEMGGAEKVTRLLAEHAAQAGIYDRVVCFVMAGSRTGTLDRLAAEANVEVVYTGCRRELHSLLPLVWRIARSRFELVFSSHGHINALTSLMRRLKLLHAERCVARESTLIFDRKFSLQKRLILRLLYAGYGAHDLIVCQTERMRESFNRNTRGRHAQAVRVLPNPISWDPKTRGQNNAATNTQNGPLKIAWCGRLADVKRPWLAIRAMKHLKRLGKYHLFIVGHGALEDQLRAEVDALNLNEQITFCGFNSSPSDIFKQCQIGLITSEIEGFPNVILEMFASGIGQVVSTDCAGGLGEFPGVTISASDPKALSAACVAAAATTPDYRAIEQELSSRTVETFAAKVFYN